MPDVTIEMVVTVTVDGDGNADEVREAGWLAAQALARWARGMPSVTVAEPLSVRVPCPRDTDGDGDCGSRFCPDCGVFRSDRSPRCGVGR